MTITERITVMVAESIGRLPASDTISYDVFWQVSAGSGAREPTLWLVLVVSNPMVGAPPLVGSIALTDPFADAAVIDDVVRSGAAFLRQRQRSLLS